MWPFTIDLNKVPINRGIIITIIVITSFFPPFLFLRVCFGRLFLHHSTLEMILFSISIGICLNLFFTAYFLLVVLESISDEKDWSVGALIASIFTTFCILAPVLYYVILHKKISESYAIRMPLDLVFFIVLYFALKKEIYRYKKNRKTSKSPAAPADPHPPVPHQESLGDTSNP